jgi:hypothetical protein
MLKIIPNLQKLFCWCWQIVLIKIQHHMVPGNDHKPSLPALTMQSVALPGKCLFGANFMAQIKEPSLLLKLIHVYWQFHSLNYTAMGALKAFVGYDLVFAHNP